MNCFYINLEKDIGRKKQMETLLISLNLNCERFNGIKQNFKEIKSGKYKLLYEKEDILVEVLYHLKQFGLDLEININDVRNFLETYKFESPSQNSLSQNEKQFLNKNITTDFYIA